MNFKTLILITITATISTLGIAWGNESIPQELKKLSTPTLIELRSELKKIKTTPQQGPLDFSLNRVAKKEEEKHISKLDDLQRQTENELKLRQSLKSSMPLESKQGSKQKEAFQKSIEEKQAEVKAIIENIN